MHKTRKILGITFFDGSAQQAIDRIRGGGLLVVPAAPALKDIDREASYRDALLAADVVLPDSGLMVMVWNSLQGDSLQRLSGLRYLRRLLKDSVLQQGSRTLWIMANPRSAAIHLAWLQQNEVRVPPAYVYVAPMYQAPVQDPGLLSLIHQLRPQHIVVTIGGGVQERLGLYLKSNLDYLPAIHCLGAALAFESGDQARIPIWADRLYLGWLLRCLSNPALYLPRYWAARRLIALIIRYRGELPPLRSPRPPAASIIPQPASEISLPPHLRAPS